MRRMGGVFWLGTVLLRREGVGVGFVVADCVVRVLRLRVDGGCGKFLTNLGFES
jgi:hypothetical protein